MAERNVVPAEPAGKRPRAERRACVRYRCEGDKPKTLITSVGYDCWPACVRDLSAGGIGLVLNRKLEAGTRLMIDLQNTAQNIAVSLEAKVAHASQQGGTWFMGCRFARRLSESELQSLLL